MDIQNNAIVIDADTEALDSQITQISNDFAETYYLDNEQQEELEMLVAKAMKLGELYERQKRQAKTQAVPEWISVKDQKPKALKNVLLSVKLKRKKNPLVCIGFYSQEPFEDPCFVLDDNFTELDNVTHWMHLPEALKTQEQDHV